MDELIKRQDALDALCDSCALASVKSECFFKKQESCLDHNAILDVPAVEERWIPCSERLPEESGRYLVTRGLNACGALWNRVYIINYSDLMGLKSERIWWNGNVGKSDFQKIDDVIAWKPLPEPYKGEQE